MKRALRLAMIPIALAGMIFTFSCSDSERRIPFGYARAVINLNLPPATADAQAGLIERIRRFLVPDAIAQAAPAAFSSVAVRVTGPDIALIEKSFAPYATISLSVPSGALRIFEVTAYVAPGDPGAALSFRGTASANCPAGATVNVPVVMGLNETKILLTDPGTGMFPNNRIIQIDDISGAGYIVRTGGEISYPINFRPWDIDFDAIGRIYIAVNEWSPEFDFQPKIIRLDSITSTSFETIASIDTFGFAAIAIDRARNLVYFARQNELFRCNTDGSSLNGPVTDHGIATLVSLAVDGGGKLYILGRDGEQTPGVYVYDFDAGSVSLPYISSELVMGSTGPEDLMIRGSSVYIANPEGDPGYKIIELTTGLEFVGAYGSQNLTLPDTATGRFYGPRRFAAIRNDELIIMDDYNDGMSNYDKLVSMTGMTGANWKTFPASGDGQAYFRFFYGS